MNEPIAAPVAPTINLTYGEAYVILLALDHIRANFHPITAMQVELRKQLDKALNLLQSKLQGQSHD